MLKHIILWILKRFTFESCSRHWLLIKFLISIYKRRIRKTVPAVQNCDFPFLEMLIFARVSAQNETLWRTIEVQKKLINKLKKMKMKIKKNLKCFELQSFKQCYRIKSLVLIFWIVVLSLVSTKKVPNQG